MVGLYDCRERFCAAAIVLSLRDCVEIGNMAGELVHQARAQPAGLSQRIEQ